ncbi:MAG: DUF72 domain-containing protein [Calditrichaeota bacterium]|nr:DUF72 domain-containing protein [Calditrichota bacterium]
MAELRIGTCSWKYKEWRGIIYQSSNPDHFLSEYARHFNTVEIDQWFWSLFAENTVRLPDRQTVENYAAAVPPDFRFTVKAANSITLTHFYRQRREDPLIRNPHFLSPTLTREFLDRLAPMQPLLGPVMFQFEYLNRQKMPSLGAFLQHLEAFLPRLPQTFTYAIEIRNPHYLNRAFFQFLQRHHIVPVLLQGYYMPNVVEVYQKFRTLIRDTVVIRLHGPDRSGIEALSGNRWDRVVIPRDDDLQAIAWMVKDLLSRGSTVYINVNNHYEGSAPLTIKRLQKILNEGGSTNGESNA